MKFFLPEWNDVIFKSYDFLNDNSVDKERIYSHELFPKPIFDGLLVSKSYLEQTKSRLQQIKIQGIHKFLRYDGEIIGDCGAWSYSKEENPPYSIKETLEFYQQLGVDYGVSLDHLCNTKNQDENERRRDLTLENAEDFFHQHQTKSLDFQIIGVAQGWDMETYADSITTLIDIGYQKIGIGGLAGAKTPKILRILSGIIESHSHKGIPLHLFGVARLQAIREFYKLGIRSFDSASPLRHSWLGPGKNYKNQYYKGYSAIRLPFIDRSGSKYVQELKKSGNYTDRELLDFVNHLHQLLIDYETNESLLRRIISEFSKFDNLLGFKNENLSKLYIQTLVDKPWKTCNCIVCKDLGIEIIIFRGNERNKRRGFHNLHVFYENLQKILSDPDFNFKEYQEENHQTDLKSINLIEKDHQDIDYFIENTSSSP